MSGPCCRRKRLATTFEERRQSERQVEEELRRCTLPMLLGMKGAGVLRDNVRLQQVLDQEIARRTSE